MVTVGVRSFRNGLVCVVLASTAATAFADGAASDRYESDWSYKVRAWKREPVGHVAIEASGLGDDRRDAASEPESCATFKPTEKQIAAYVGSAKRVSQRGFLHETDWSACHATGTLILRSGAHAQWMVQRLGAGYIAIEGKRYYFDCPDCKLGEGAAKK